MNLVQKITISLLFFLCGASAQTMTVCEVLMGLDDPNHKEIKVRGTWILGHVGEILIPEEPCPHQTVRDGWVWQDAIQVAPESNRANTLNHYRPMENKDRTTPAKTVATLSGRLETRGHFKTAGGRPIGFLDFVAILLYVQVEQQEVVAYKQGEQERELEFRRRPYAKRVRK